MRAEVREQTARASRQAFLVLLLRRILQLHVRAGAAPQPRRQHRRERVEGGGHVVVGDPAGKLDACGREQRLILDERADGLGVVHVRGITEAHHHAAQSSSGERYAHQMAGREVHVIRDGVGERVSVLACGRLDDDIGVAERGANAIALNR